MRKTLNLYTEDTKTMQAKSTVKKVHSLVDKVYHPTNLKLAWKKVKSNRGSGGIDKISIQDFTNVAEEELQKLHQQLKEATYEPMPVRRVYIQKRGKPNKKRPLGIPAIRDRVCQQALKNRLEPIFEQGFNDCSFGYRPGRSPHQAMRKIYRELLIGYEWIVDADLRDFFGSVQHERLIDMIAEKVSDGRILKLIRKMLKAGYMEQGIRHLTQEGTPQGSVISPLLSNIYLNQFDHEMESRGYRLTRFADDWVVLCRTRGEAIKALEEAREVLKSLGLTIHPEKTKITNINKGFEFLGYKLKRGKGLKLAKNKIKKRMNSSNIYAFPKEESIKRFKATIKERTKRRIPLTTKEIIDWINPVIRGWGIYYRKAHIRKLFNKLQRWIVRRIWSHHYKRWRNYGWKYYNESRLYGEFKLVSLLTLIPDLRLKTVFK